MMPAFPQIQRRKIMPNTAALPILLKELRLTAMGKQWQTLAQQAIDKDWTPEEYLAILCEEEVALRYQKRVLRYNQEAKLPPSKSLSSFDFSLIPAIKKSQIEQKLKETHWVQKAENLLFFGPSGVGKTHLAAAMGYGLIEKGYRVRFFNTTALIQLLQKAREELSVLEALTRLDKYSVLILDDIGYVKKSEVETQVLFELIAHRYESGSIILTSNQPFSQWDQIFDDNMMTVAAIDRIVHHATVIDCQGESYRKQQALKKENKVE